MGYAGPSDEPRVKRLLDGIKNAGRSEVIEASLPPLSFPNPVTLIDLTAEDDAAEAITIYLSATRESSENTNPVDFRPYLVAIIEWGTAGFQNQAVVDFCRGLSFTLHASYVRVKVYLDREAFLGVNPSPAEEIRAAATAAYGVRPGHLSSPTRTLYVRDLVAGGVSTPQLIPDFAREVTLAWGTPATPLPAYVLDILDSAGLIVSTRIAGGGFGAGTQQVPLPGDARYVRVTSPLGAPTPQDFRFIFGLSF